MKRNSLLPKPNPMKSILCLALGPMPRARNPLDVRSNQFTIPEEKSSNGNNLLWDGMPRLATTKAGAYFFFPSIEMLRNQFKLS